MMLKPGMLFSLSLFLWIFLLEGGFSAAAETSASQTNAPTPADESSAEADTVLQQGCLDSEKPEKIVLWYLFDRSVPRNHRAQIKVRLKKKWNLLHTTECKNCDKIHHVGATLVRGLQSMKNRAQLNQDNQGAAQYQMILVAEQDTTVSFERKCYDAEVGSPGQGMEGGNGYFSLSDGGFDVYLGSLFLPIGVWNPRTGKARSETRQPFMLGGGWLFLLTDQVGISGEVALFSDQQQVDSNADREPLTGFMGDTNLNWNYYDSGNTQIRPGVGFGQMVTSLFSPFYIKIGLHGLWDSLSIRFYYLELLGNNPVVSAAHPSAVNGLYVSLGWLFE